METGMDDQLARCKVAEEEGWGIVASKSLSESINRLLEHGKISEISSGLNGSEVLARKLILENNE